MSTKFVDRRSTAAPDTTEAEDDRMRRRQAVREQAAQRDFTLQPALLAEQDIRTSEARCDTLADQHARTCQPWQNELRELEASAIGRIGRREPADPEEDERRAELTKMIAAATTDLETAIAAEREIQSIARRKARLIRQGNPPSDTILTALTKPPLVNPKLLGEEFVLREKTKWLKARQNAAEKVLKICRYNVTEISAKRMSGDLSVWRGKAAAWEHELEAVGAEIDAAMAEGKDLHRAMIDE